MKKGVRTEALPPPPVSMVDQTPADVANEEIVAGEMLLKQQMSLMETVGQIRAHVGYRRIAEAMSISKLEELKRTKLYKSLKGVEIGGQLFDGRWESFCDLALERSARSVDEEIENFRDMGESLQALRDAGTTIRQLRLLRQIEPEQRQILIGKVVANANDPDEIKDIVEAELATRDKLISQLEIDRRAMQDSRDRVQKHANDLEVENLKLKARPVAEQIEDLTQDIRRSRAEVVALIHGMRKSCEHFSELASKNPTLTQEMIHNWRLCATAMSEWHDACAIDWDMPAGVEQQLGQSIEFLTR